VRILVLVAFSSFAQSHKKHAKVFLGVSGGSLDSFYTAAQTEVCATKMPG